jgi:hypothetical protein
LEGAYFDVGRCWFGTEGREIVWWSTTGEKERDCDMEDKETRELVIGDIHREREIK